MFTVTSYDITVVETGSFDMPLVEETDVTPARIVEIMRTLLAGPRELRSHRQIMSSTTTSADGTVMTLKAWTITRTGDDQGAFTYPESLWLSVGKVVTLVEPMSLHQLRALERKTSRALVDAQVGHEPADVVATAKAAHDDAVARCERAEALTLARVGALPTNLPPSVTGRPSTAQATVERRFERGILGV